MFRLPILRAASRIAHRDGKRLRYEVDLAAAERSGLKIAAPMLISARKVSPPADPPGEEAR